MFFIQVVEKKGITINPTNLQQPRGLYLVISDLLHGDFTKVVEGAVMDSSNTHQNKMVELLSNMDKAANYYINAALKNSYEYKIYGN